MSAGDLEAVVTFKPDTQSLKQSLSQIESSTSKALSGGSSGNKQTAIEKELANATKLQDRIKLLGESRDKLASQPGMERQLGKVNQELATQISHYKNMAKNSSDYLSNLEKEVNFRKQAAQYINQANKNDNLYSAHSDRQFQMLRQISNGVPGGGVVSKIISGFGGGGGGGPLALPGMGGAAAGGEGASAGAGSALAGGAAAAIAGGVAVIVAALVKGGEELANRAEQLARNAPDSTSSLGQLRSQMEQTNIRKDANAVSGGVTLASIDQWRKDTQDSIIGGIWNFVTGNDEQKKQRAVQEKINGGLGGDDKVTWDRIKQQGQDVNLDLARQKQSLGIQQYRQDRDHALDLQQFDIQTSNQKFDLNRQAFRQNQDYQIQLQQYNENHAGEMAKKQFDLQMKYSDQAYQIQVQRGQQDFGIAQKYRVEDLTTQRSRSYEDFGISRQDSRYDFGVSQARNQESFNIAQSRNLTARENQKNDMALGGASPLQWLQSARDFNLQQQYAKEDFERSKRIATEDYTRSDYVANRDFQRSDSRTLADFARQTGRDSAAFSLSQQRIGEDRSIQVQQAREGRQLQIEDELYNRKYQGIQLELQHNRNLEDETTAWQRLNQSIGLQAQRLANQGQDIQIDQALQNQNFNIDAYRALRNQAWNEQDFAGAVRNSDAFGAYGQSLTDPTFADASARYATATGQKSLASQVADSQKGIDWGGIFGQGLAASIPGVGLLGMAGQGIGTAWNFFTGGNSQNQQPQMNFNPQINNTFPTVGGISQQQANQYNDKYMQMFQQMQKDFADYVNSANLGAGWPSGYTGY